MSETAVMAPPAPAPAATPVDKRREAALAKMNKAAQKVVKEIEARTCRHDTAQVVYYYDLGVLADKLISDEKTYGSDVVDLMAQYFGMSHGRRYFTELSRFARAYNVREDLLAEAQTPMTNGKALTYEHFLHLMRLTKAKDRRTWLAKVRRENLSASELLMQLDAVAPAAATNNPKGRPPAVPKSPLAGVQRTRQVALTASNWIDTFTDQGLMPLEEEEPTDPLLETLEEAESQVRELVSKGGLFLARLMTAKKKLQDKRDAGQAGAPAADDDAGDEADDDAAPAPDEEDDFEQLAAPRARRPAPKAAPAGKKGGR